MRLLVLLAALALAGCAQEPSAADVATTPAPPPSPEAVETSEAPAAPAPPVRREGEFAASVGTAYAEQASPGALAEFEVPAGAADLVAVGNWSSTAGTGAQMRLRAPSGDATSAGTIGAMVTEGSIQVRVVEPEPGTWRIEWSAAGAAAAVRWTSDVTFA